MRACSRPEVQGTETEAASSHNRHTDTGMDNGSEERSTHMPGLEHLHPQLCLRQAVIVPSHFHETKPPRPEIYHLTASSLDVERLEAKLAMASGDSLKRNVFS